MKNFWSKHGFSIPVSLCLSHMSSAEKMFIHSHCLRKVKFRSMRDAKRRIEILKGISPERHYGVYKCDFCGGFHVTSCMGDEGKELSKCALKKRRIREKFLTLGYINEPIEIP